MDYMKFKRSYSETTEKIQEAAFKRGIARKALSSPLHVKKWILTRLFPVSLATDINNIAETHSKYDFIWQVIEC